MLIVLMYGLAFIAGMAVGGVIADRALAVKRRILAEQRYELWLTAQDARQAEAEIERLQNRYRRLQRLARERPALAENEREREEPPERPPPGHSAA